MQIIAVNICSGPRIEAGNSSTSVAYASEAVKCLILPMNLAIKKSQNTSASHHDQDRGLVSDNLTQLVKVNKRIS